MDALDYLKQLFKGAGSSDEETQQKLAGISPDRASSIASSLGMSDSDTAHVDPLAAYGGSPSKPVSPAPTPAPQPQAPVADVPMPPADMSLNIPDVNSVPSSYDVNVSDNTVTQNGKPESLPSLAGIPGKAPYPNGEMPTEPVTPSIPQQNAPIEQNTPESASKLGSKGSNTLQSLVAPSTSSDNDARNAMLGKQQDLKKVGAISGLVGGIGDAIGNAAIPYGGKGSSGTQQKISDNTNALIEQNKDQFEEKLKNDPNSEISKSYRAMVMEIAPDLAKNPSFNNMTAKAIGDKLPLIDTVMKAKAQELTRQYMLQNQKFLHDQSYTQKAQQAYESDPEIKKALDMNGSFDRAEGLLEAAKHTPISSDQIALMLAPATTGVKRFNDREIKAFGGVQSITGTLDRIAKKAASGKLDEQDAAQYRGLINSIRHTNSQIIQERGKAHAQNLSSLNGRDWKQNYSDLAHQDYNQPANSPSGSQKDPLGIL